MAGLLDRIVSRFFPKEVPEVFEVDAIRPQALGYPTKGCEVREVTAEDIDTGVKKWAEDGITRADQLNHLQLKEQILACKTAFDRGFTWEFKKPSTEGCKKEPSRGLHR